MKKHLLWAIALVCFVQTAWGAEKKEVIIFSQPCHYCELMKEDLKATIIPANPDIQFTILDIQQQKNYRLLLKFAQKHDLRGNIGLPLIFIGDQYLMGWGPEAKTTMQNYIDDFKQENLTRLPY